MQRIISIGQVVNKLEQMEHPQQLHHYLFSEEEQSRHKLQGMFFGTSIEVIGVLLNVKILKWIPDNIVKDKKKKIKKEHNRQISFLMLLLGVLKMKIGDLSRYDKKMRLRVEDKHLKHQIFFQKYLALLLVYFHSKTSTKIKYLILITLSNGTCIQSKQKNLLLLCKNWKKSEDQYPNLLLRSQPSYRDDFIQTVVQLEIFLKDKQTKKLKIWWKIKKNKKILRKNQKQSHQTISTMDHIVNTSALHQQEEHKQNVLQRGHNGNSINQQIFSEEHEQQYFKYWYQNFPLSQQFFEIKNKKQEYQEQDQEDLNSQFKSPISEDSSVGYLSQRQHFD